MNNEKKLSFETLQIHAGNVVDKETYSVATPIYQTSAYVFEDSQHAIDLFTLSKEGNIYTRLMNPTNDVLEKRLTALEDGVASIVTSSGMSAVLYSILNVAQSGDEIISASSIYGGTYTLFNERLEKQFGIKANLVDIDNFEEIRNNINDKTRAIFFESMGNPGMNIPDFEKIVEIAHENGLPVIVDNTLGTPYLIKLKNYGVDIIVHSLTKYIGGHGTSIGGSITDLGTFDFKNNPRFEMFNTPDDAYHGLVYADVPGSPYILKIRVGLMRDTGAVLSPFNSFLFLQGIETLSLRVDRHSQSAMTIAKYLQNHDKVKWVNYPALEDNINYERYKKYFVNGAGGLLTFGVKGGKEAGIKFVDSLKIFSLVANLADAKSLVVQPAVTTHSQLNDEQLISAGAPPELIRLSVGLEGVQDLIDDIDSALSEV